jgi:ribonuclease III
MPSAAKAAGVKQALRSSVLLRAIRNFFRPPAPVTDRLEPDTPSTSRDDPQYAALEQLTGHSIRNLALYKRALTHRSVARGETDSHLISNERLEFLGDAVLGFVTAEDLHHRFPDRDEGFLTRLRAKLVNGQALARAAQGIELATHVRMSGNMEQSGGRRNQTILADAFEALIGALYLDLGLEAARAFIHRTMLDQVNLLELAVQRDNYKSLLLEFAQARGWRQPVYQVVSEEGPSHEKTFTVEVLVEQTPCGLGMAGSKKQAEQHAARQALTQLQRQEKPHANTPPSDMN